MDYVWDDARIAVDFQAFRDGVTKPAQLSPRVEKHESDANSAIKILEALSELLSAGEEK
jgi:hypothetical protein